MWDGQELLSSLFRHANKRFERLQRSNRRRNKQKAWKSRGGGGEQENRKTYSPRRLRRSENRNKFKKVRIVVGTYFFVLSRLVTSTSHTQHSTSTLIQLSISGVVVGLQILCDLLMIIMHMMIIVDDYFSFLHDIRALTHSTPPQHFLVCLWKHYHWVNESTTVQC